MNYRISPRADQDIEEICEYIARDNIAAADKLDQRIHEAILLLAEFPRIGHTRADVEDPRFLFWSVGRYIVAYRLEDESLIVVRVLHGARDFRSIFRR